MWSCSDMPSRTVDNPSQPTRVLVVLASAQRRGAELQGFELAQGLASRGYCCETMAVVRGSGEHALDVEIAGRSRWSVRGLLCLRRRCRGAITVAHGSSSLLAVALATFGTTNRWVYRNISDPAAWAGGTMRRARTGAFLRRASAIVALWPGAAESLARLYRLRAERLTVIPNDRDPRRFAPISAAERSAARAALGLTGSVVLFLGALSEEKEPLLAVDVARRLPDVTLVIAGEGPMRAEVEAFASEEAPGRVVLLGNCPDPGQVIAASDLLLMTSRTEGMPGAIIESLLRGVPVVATAVGAVPVMLEDPRDGLVAPVGDAEAIVACVRTVLDRRADTEVSGDLGDTGERAARAARAYAPSTVLDRWEALLASVTAGTRRAGR